MELAHRWFDRNLTRKELVVAILILALLIGSFSRYSLRMFALAERSMINNTVININTALNYRSSIAVMMGKYEVLELLLNTNPMGEIKKKSEIDQFDNVLNDSSIELVEAYILPPSNYGGVVIDDSDPNLASGNWYYDQDDNFLFYNIENSEFFSTNIDGPARVRYKVTLSYTDQDNDSAFNPLVDKFLSIKLQAIDKFEWFF